MPKRALKSAQLLAWRRRVHKTKKKFSYHFSKAFESLRQPITFCKRPLIRLWKKKPSTEIASSWLKYITIFLCVLKKKDYLSAALTTTFYTLSLWKTWSDFGHNDLAWFKSFTFEHKQFVTDEGWANRIFRICINGVPQRFVLWGPLLVFQSTLHLCSSSY